MNLLIITQAVDRNNSVLGFFHRWIEEFAKHYEKVSVICLEKGVYDLPKNVEVFSLGREKFENLDIENSLKIENWKLKIFRRFRFVFRFSRLIWKLRKDYDAVFVHMNQEYVLLGGLFWIILGKKIYLWRNHPDGTPLTKLAVFMANKVFCTSKFSYTAKFKKTILMPVGIDTDLFCNFNKIINRGKTILSFGRIDPIKRVDILIDEIKKINEVFDADFHLEIVGKSSRGKEKYGEIIKDKLSSLIQNKKVSIIESVKNNSAPELYNRNFIFVNLTPSGSLDKTIFEAMACGTLILTSNNFFQDILEEEEYIREEDLHSLGKKIKDLFCIDKDRAEYLSQKKRDFVLGLHSIDKLFERFISEIKT